MDLNQKKQITLRAIWETIVDTPDNEYVQNESWLKVTSKSIYAPHANGIFRCERKDLDETNMDDFVRNEIKHYQSRGYNFRWKTCELTTRKLEASLKKNGMILKDVLYGFCITPDEMPENIFQEGNEVYELSEERYEDWLVVQKDGWNVPAEGIEFLKKNKEMYLSMKDASIFISYHNGIPGGAAGYVKKNDYAYLVGGAVVPELRGKGLYRDLLFARFNDLKKQNLPAVIHCVSNTSAPIIQKLGFQKVCEINSYELPE